MRSAGRRYSQEHGAPVLYGIFESRLGATLVAAGRSGVCAIAFADSEEELHAELRQRFPGTDLQRSDAAVEPYAQRLLLSLTHGTALDLPLDVRGTPFQQRVWAALQAIPRGSRHTYAEVAGALDLPATSARAVAAACAANPVAVAIPCHRVVGADGTLRGFRWGIERKRQLLRLEQTLA